MKRISQFLSLGVGLFVVAFLLLTSSAYASYGEVSTFLSRIYSGDGGEAIGAYLDFEEDVSFDGSGNLYVADTYNNVIRRIDTGGTISTFAGTGSYGDTDGGSGGAEFALPQGVTSSSDGTVYVADTFNHKIKKISGGSVSTLVSDGLSYPSAVTLIGGTLFISDTGNSAIKKVSTSGGNVSTVTSNLSVPEKITPSEDGHLYVADSGDHKVKKVNVNSGGVEVIAGSGADGYVDAVGTSAQFKSVIGVAIDVDGNKLYVTDGDGYTDTIRTIDLSSRQVSTLSVDENMATINYPKGIALRGGHAYVANSGIGTIHKFSKADGSSEHFAGKNRFGNDDGAKDSVILGRPFKPVYSSSTNKIYLAQNNQIKEIDRSSGQTSQVIGSVVDAYREGSGDRVRFSTISGLTVDSGGNNLYVADHWNNRIRKVDLGSKEASLVSGTGETNCSGSCNGYAEGNRDSAKFNNPSDVAISPGNDYLYVTDTSNNRVRKVRISDGQTWLLAGSGVAGHTDGTGSGAQFDRPYGLAIDGGGDNLYVADSNNNKIRKIEISSGKVTTVAGSGQNGFRDGIGTDAVLSFPEYITVASNGKVFFSEVGSHRIKYFDPSSSTVITIAGSGDRGFKNGSRFNAKFNNPKGLLAVDNSLYVADNWNDLLREIDIAGNPPYADPAPEVGSVYPTNKYKVAGNSGDTKMLELSGKNFSHGAKVRFGNYDVLATYVKSSTKLAIKVPFGQLPPGWYKVYVTNIDGQVGSRDDAFIVLNADGSVPEKVQQAAEAQSQFFAYIESFLGGYTLTAGKLFPGSGVNIIAGLLEGFGPQVRIFDRSGKLKSQFFAFAKHLRSGVRVAACDLDGDGYSEIITGAGKGGRPHIRTFNGYGEPVITPGFFALDGKFQGGVNLACGDVTGNGKPEIIVAASKGGGPHVTVHKPDGRVIANYMAYGKTFRGGIKLGTADLDGDGKDEIVTGPEKGAPHVQLFDVGAGKVKRLNPGFYAFHPNFQGGLSVSGGDVTGNGKDELMVSQRTEGQAWVKIYRGKDQVILKNFLAYMGSFKGGAVVASSDVDNDGKEEILTIPGSEGSPQVRVFDYESL
ncbi:hypothetical protein KKC60_05070 [Patescibacteria group bacterium]|nr:hypothetical protein [Patescibacteria group bacterium]